MARLTAEAVTRSLGLRVRELRRARGWTQQDAAERLKIAVPNYAHIEQGRRLVRIDTLVRLANLFEVTVADLFAEPRAKAVRPGRPRKDEG
jgi:transcriptional regulator with XRE-family HTH domain